MNILDWILLFVAASGLLLGYKRGLVDQLISLVSLILAYIVAYNYYQKTSQWLAEWVRWPELDGATIYGYSLSDLDWQPILNQAIAFILIFIVVRLACSIVGAVVNVLMKAPGLNMLNKWSGAMLGLLGGAIIIVVAVNILTAIPSEPLQRQLSESKTAQFIKQHMPAFTNPIDLWPWDQREKDPFKEPERVQQPMEASRELPART